MTSLKHDKTTASDVFLLKADQYENAGDFKSAFKCLLAGAQFGDTGCQINLGNYYAAGKGVRKNAEEAARWYKKAYKAGSGAAATNLAINRRNAGRTGATMIWFKKAIAMDDGEAYIELAKIYKARKDKKKEAVALLKQALLIDPDHITEYSREVAISLLQEMDASNGDVARSS